MIIKNIKNKIIRTLNGFWLFTIGPFLRKFKKKPLPSFEKVMLHIGCGDFNDKRYINIDARQGWHIDYTAKAEDCHKFFSNDSVDLIYACHVLEHISHQNLKNTLSSLCRILKKGGILRISVPDFDKILAIYNEKKIIGDINCPLMGGQGYKDNFHFSVFNKNYLEKLLLDSGFSETRAWEPGNASFHNFSDWSGRKIDIYNKTFEISLNIEGIK